MPAPAAFVRRIQRGETIKALVEEMKALAWVNFVEYAVVQLATGDRVLVSGGQGGIEFLLNKEETAVFMALDGSQVQVKRIYFHTHPRVTGPSEGDLKVLRILRQTRSYIFEIGGERQGTLIRPK
jgi:hypothetical protein